MSFVFLQIDFPHLFLRKEGNLKKIVLMKETSKRYHQFIYEIFKTFFFFFFFGQSVFHILVQLLRFSNFFRVDRLTRGVGVSSACGRISVFCCLQKFSWNLHTSELPVGTFQLLSMHLSAHFVYSGSVLCACMFARGYKTLLLKDDNQRGGVTCRSLACFPRPSAFSPRLGGGVRYGVPGHLLVFI